MLTEMHQLAFKIDPDFSADRSPTMAEGVVLGQITAGLRMYHAIEETPVQICLRMAGRSVRRVSQLGIAFHQPREDVTLDHHEAGRRFVDLDETFGVDIAAHAA